MKGAIVMCFLVLATVALARPNEQYTNQYDNINIEEILSNHRLLQPYILCCLNKGKCTAEAKELKSHIKEAMQNDCAKCNDFQRKTTTKVIDHLIDHESAYWSELKAFYDPTGKYSSKYEKEHKAAKA